MIHYCCCNRAQLTWFAFAHLVLITFTNELIIYAVIATRTVAISNFAFPAIFIPNYKSNLNADSFDKSTIITCGMSRCQHSFALSISNSLACVENRKWQFAELCFAKIPLAKRILDFEPSDVLYI